MGYNLHWRVLIQLACVVTCLALFFSQKNLVPDIHLFPMDPAVCISSNVTFMCNSSSNYSAQISFMIGKHGFEKISNFERIGEQSVEFTLNNVSRADNGLLVCCTLGDTCNTSKEAVSILNVMYSEKKDELKPIDPQLCTTQNVTFSCKYSKPPVSGHSVGFAVKNSSTNRMFVPVPENSLTASSDTESNVTLLNVTTRTIVRCYYWDSFGNIGTAEQLGHTSTISVYPMPVELEAVNCIVDNYIVSMNCTWDTGSPYKKGSTPEVMFRWRIVGYSTAWNNCSDLNQEYRYCSWPNTSSGDFSMKLIDLQLIQKSPCGKNITSNFTVDTSQIVKPRPVTELISRTINSTCIYVQYSTTNSQVQYGKEHRVIITNKWSEPEILTFNTTMDSEMDVHSKTYCNLHPYTEYTFTLDLQPTGSEAGFYSDPRQTVAVTFSDFPNASPEVAPGGYSWNPKACKPPNANREVCVPLKSIAPIDENGPMKGLVISYIDEKGKISHVDLAEDLKYACVSNLMCNTAYVFYIRARNVNGTSAMNSSIQVPASKIGIEQPNFIVEAGYDSNVTVSWDKIEGANSFTVFWCRNRNGKCDVKEDINWEMFAGKTTEPVIQIEKTNSPQDFLYGVSPMTDIGSSGFSWEERVYLKDAYPQREVKNLAVTPGSEDNTLVVTWDHLSYQSDQPYIAVYCITYNKVGDKQYTVVNVSAAGEARLVLYNLERDQAYNVSVRAVTKNGQYGPVGQTQISTPVNNKLRTWQIVLIAGGTIVGVFIITIMVIFIMRYYRKKRKSLMDAKKIKIPTDDFMTDNNANGIFPIVRQNSDDSGYDPMTPPPDRFVDQPSFQKTSNPDCQPPDDYSIATVENSQSPAMEHRISPQSLPVCQLQERPDGYYTATVQNSQSPAMDHGITPQNLPGHIFSTDNLVPSPVVAHVGFVMKENPSYSGETFVKKIDSGPLNNETAVKTRNGSGDSGVSGISDSSERDVEIRTDENVLKKSTEIESDIRRNEISDYVSINNASKPSSLRNDNSSALIGSENSAFSDMSETFVKEVSDTSETVVKIRIGENIGKNISKIEQIVKSNDNVSEYVSVNNATNPSSFTHDDPSALDGFENSAFTTDLDSSNVGSSPDYVKAQAAQDSLTTQLSSNSNQSLPLSNTDSIIHVDNFQDQFPENVDQHHPTSTEKCNISYDDSSPLLTVIPCPIGLSAHVDQSGSVLTVEKSFSPVLTEPSLETDPAIVPDKSSIGDNDHVLKLTTRCNSQHAHDDDILSEEHNVSDFVKRDDTQHVSHHIFSTEDMPKVQTTDQQHLLGYDQATIQQTTPDYYRLADEQTEKNFDTDAQKTIFPAETYVTLPSTTSSQKSTVTPFNATRNLSQENTMSEMNTNQNSGQDCSASNSVPSGGYVSPTLACKSLGSSNISDSPHSFNSHITGSSVETSNVPSSLASSSMSPFGNGSPLNAVRHQTPPAVIGQNPGHSISNDNYVDYLPAPSNNLNEGDRNMQSRSHGYVYSTNVCPDFNASSTANNDMPLKDDSMSTSPTQNFSGYVLSTDFPEICSNGHQEKYRTGNQFQRESQQPNNECSLLDENITNIKDDCQEPNTNGYVGLNFISGGNSNKANEDVVERQVEHLSSDSDRNRLEDENSEVYEMQQRYFNGYVSSDFAMERL